MPDTSTTDRPDSEENAENRDDARSLDEIDYSERGQGVRELFSDNTLVEAAPEENIDAAQAPA